MRASRALIASSLLFVAGCGKEPLPRADAKQALRVLKRASPPMGASALVAGQITPCEGGGHVRVVEAPKSEGNAMAPGAAKGRAKLAYEKCSDGDTTIDGTYAVEVGFPLGLALGANSQVKVRFNGELTFSGRVTGVCDVDIEVTSQASAPQDAQTGGTFCGHDVSSL